jgi:L-rhamnose isomerase
VDDFAALRTHAEDLGVAIGTINSNTFQDDDFKFGSLTHVDPKIRQKAIDHNLDCVDVMDATGSRDLKIWLADGTNYAGQGDLTEAFREYVAGMRSAGWTSASDDIAGGKAVGTLRKDNRTCSLEFVSAAGQIRATIKVAQTK